MAEEDLIFGKNRHFFGGIEPSNMSAFSVTNDGGSVKLQATLPSDTVIDGQTLCTVKGAVIRRKATDYPLNEFDGDLVMDISSSGTYSDEEATITGTYYYSAFPYTTQGVYNRNPANRAVFNEPSPMTEFKAVSIYTAATKTAKVSITASLPEGVAGAKICKSTVSYPVSETDGVEFADVTESGVYEDTDVEIGTTYYYSAFPYTSTGAYNRSTTNRASVTPSMVIEDLDPMPTFTSKSVYDATLKKAKVQITAALPDKAIGAIIRKSTTAYPETESDGDEVANISSGTTIEDSDVVVGTKYYYSAFPYTENGYSRDTENRTECTPSSYEYLYGFDINLSDENPETRVGYPSDVDNSGFTAAKMGSSAFSYGGWPSTPGEKFMPRPCMLTYAGVVDHYLNPDDYTKKVDGTASKVADTSFSGNAMIEWNKIFVKRWESEGVYHFRCSDVKLDDDYECWSNYDRQNNEIPHFYTPIYFGSNVSNKMRSISGQANSVGTTAETEINLAKANGTEWYTEVLADRLLIQDLLVMMFKSTDLQTALGMGVCSASVAIASGTMNTKGMFWGSSDKTSGVKVFGMENWWGNIRRRIGGWVYVDGVQKVKITRGTKDGSTATDYNLDGTGYKIVPDSNISASGYISGMKTESFGRLPNATSGSSSTYEADYAYSNNSETKYANVGGNWNNDLTCGPFYVNLTHDASYSYTTIGSALSCKPLA